MANADFTTSPPNACPKYTSSVDPNREESAWLISPLEKALEEERERLMLANSMQGVSRSLSTPRQSRLPRWSTTPRSWI